MAMTKSFPTRSTGACLFRAVKIDEPISVWVATFRSPREQGRCLGELMHRKPPGLVVVSYIASSFPPLEVAALLDLSTGIARRVVLTTAPCSPEPGTRVTADNLRAETQRRWPCLVQFEPEPERAVIGVMQSLREGDTLVLLWPDDANVPSASSLVAQGARWRASCDTPEDGEFHWLPAASETS